MAPVFIKPLISETTLETIDEKMRVDFGNKPVSPGAKDVKKHGKNKSKSQTATKRKLSVKFRSGSPRPSETKHNVSLLELPAPSKKRKKNPLTSPINIEADFAESVTQRHTLEVISEKESGLESSNMQSDLKTIKKASINSTISKRSSIQSQGSSKKQEPQLKPFPPKLSKEQLADKYPVFANEQLIQRFQTVSMTNNQKGRIRQVLKELLHGTSEANLPEVIHNKIQLILKSTTTLTDTDLRKIRVLYNMLNTAIAAQEDGILGIKESTMKKDSSEIKNGNEKSKNNEAVKNSGEIKNGNEKVKNTNEMKKNSSDNKASNKKGPKRYVVFVGNLPKEINKEQILDHFSDLRPDIVDVRIPPPKEDKKSAIAYVELNNETSFEMALSKHHSMLARKRINVLYTTQQNSKVTKAEAKAKASKLVAMVKSGQLIGSVPLKKKRSQRRAKQRAFLKAANKDTA